MEEESGAAAITEHKRLLPSSSGVLKYLKETERQNEVLMRDVPKIPYVEVIQQREIWYDIALNSANDSVFIESSILAHNS